jgi:hypothetical protein
MFLPITSSYYEIGFLPDILGWLYILPPRTPSYKRRFLCRNVSNYCQPELFLIKANPSRIGFYVMRGRRGDYHIGLALSCRALLPLFLSLSLSFSLSLSLFLFLSPSLSLSLSLSLPLSLSFSISISLSLSLSLCVVPCCRRN